MSELQFVYEASEPQTGCLALIIVHPDINNLVYDEALRALGRRLDRVVA